jgi:hypothetical protein
MGNTVTQKGIFNQNGNHAACFSLLRNQSSHSKRYVCVEYQKQRGTLKRIKSLKCVVN